MSSDPTSPKPRVIVVFVKYPEPGRVKTRLAATVGNERAVEIYRQLVAAVFRQLPTDETVLALFDPPEREREITSWLGELRSTGKLQLAPQAAGDLGDRILVGLAMAFTRGFEQVAVIGTDCVELDAKAFSETWSALDSADVVLGPTEDGGYYLLALKSLEPGLFRKISWSTSAVLEQTLARASERGLVTHQLPKLADVDTEGDWLRAQARLVG